jgi:hypothetical protein
MTSGKSRRNAKKLLSMVSRGKLCLDDIVAIIVMKERGQGSEKLSSRAAYTVLVNFFSNLK